MRNTQTTASKSWRSRCANGNIAGSIGLLGVFAFALAAPALAHHPLGGATPTTFWHGLLSGIGHPVIGVDHLAFIVAIGVASAFAGNRILGPAMFVTATLVGCLIALGSGPMAQLELLVAASITLIGIMVLAGGSFATPIYMIGFALAGLLHGAAYAGAMVGAEATPIAAYLIGLALVQFAIAMAMTWITIKAWKASSALAIEPRLAGAVVAGVGATFLVENLEKMIF